MVLTFVAITIKRFRPDRGQPDDFSWQTAVSADRSLIWIAVCWSCCFPVFPGISNCCSD